MRNLWRKETWQLGWAVAWRAYLLLVVAVFVLLPVAFVLLVALWPFFRPDLTVEQRAAFAMYGLMAVAVVPAVGHAVRLALLRSEAARRMARELLAEGNAG